MTESQLPNKKRLGEFIPKPSNFGLFDFSFSIVVVTRRKKNEEFSNKIPEKRSKRQRRNIKSVFFLVSSERGKNISLNYKLFANKTRLIKSPRPRKEEKNYDKRK